MNPIHGIYAICDNSLTPHLSHESIARKLLEGGIRLIQLRMKGENDPARIRESARGILALKRDFKFTFILNDWPELAGELNADGVHLGRDDLPLPEARQILGDEKLIGYSSHSLSEALEAEQLGADYVALGAIFTTPLKGPGHPIQGLPRLREAVRSLRVPLVAIGGIDRANFMPVVETDVAAIAMIRALNCAQDIRAEATWFVQEWNRLEFPPPRS
jgi:thiamine-phosphate diphosphorylase